jgi:tetratricopeptide (TPR) repeat protein
VVLQKYGVWPINLWHYAVIVGYDREKGELVLRSGEKRRLTMPLEVFEYTWKDGDRWAMVALPPSNMPATAERKPYLQSLLALEKARQPRAAATAYTAYLARWPDELGASIGLANAHYALSELGQAEAVLRKALAQHPDSLVVLNNLAQTLSDAGRADEALELIERAAAAGGPHAAAISETRALILERLQRR